MHEQRETLAQWADKLRKMQTSKAGAWFLLAKEVCTFAENQWPALSQDADGKNLTTWVREALGKPFDFYERRHKAVQSVDESARRVLSEDALLWFAHRVPKDSQREILMACAKKSNKDNSGFPLSKAQTEATANRILNVTRSRKCRRCALIDTWLSLQGMKVPADLEEAIRLLREEQGRAKPKAA